MHPIPPPLATITRHVAMPTAPQPEIASMIRRTTLLAATALALATPAFAQMAHSGAMQSHAAQSDVMVGGQAMSPAKTIVANAVNSADHTTLVAAVKAAGLVDALSGKGPFTVFAPTNEAFSDLPAGTVDTLVKPENKAMLTTILTYHVVPGDYSTTKLRALILAGHGRAELKTLQGEPLTFMMNGSSNITVRDAKGGTADITISDVNQSNGLIQVVDHVLMPAA